MELAAAAQLAQTLLDMAADSDIDPDMVREFAHQVLASGTPEACDELSATVTPISDGVHDMLYIPWKRGHSPTVRHTAVRSAARCLQLRLRPRDRRPDCRENHVGGRLSSLHHQACDRRNKQRDSRLCHLRIGNTRHHQQANDTYRGGPSHSPSQGAAGNFGNRDRIQRLYQHYKIEYRDMYREAFIVSRKGVVRTPDKWGWHTGHFSIAGFGLIR